MGSYIKYGESIEEALFMNSKGPLISQDISASVSNSNFFCVANCLVCSIVKRRGYLSVQKIPLTITRAYGAIFSWNIDVNSSGFEMYRSWLNASFFLWIKSG